MITSIVGFNIKSRKSGGNVQIAIFNARKIPTLSQTSHIGKMKTQILVILGPTATGKSDLAVWLAKKLNGEVVSADSRQIYKGLDIGTGKITKQEMKGVQHHLLDVADPKKKFSVFEYVKLAKKAIADIFKRKKLPIICGGTGFYIQTLVDGLDLPEVPPNKILRHELEKLSNLELLNRLEKLDPVRFKTIDKNNSRRIVRSIEIATSLGSVPQLNKNSAKYNATFIGLNLPADELKKRIRIRLLKRLKSGMIEEVQSLHAKGLSWKRMDELGLEYRFLSAYIQGKINRAEMVEKLNTAISHYAKRQMTWFKRDERIMWFEPNQRKKILEMLTK